MAKFCLLNFQGDKSSCHCRLFYVAVKIKKYLFIFIINLYLLPTTKIDSYEEIFTDLQFFNMMHQVLPATVEELNTQQTFKPSPFLKKADFEDIPVEKRLRRDFSLPTGVEDWNITNFGPYLYFDNVLENAVINNEFDVLASPEDRLVPETDLRDRSSSISSVTSMMEDKQLTFHNFGVKTINTVCRDSGSTCISSDHTYFDKSPLLAKSLDPEETYQNLDIFLQEVPEMSVPETIPSSPFSPLPSTNSEDSIELTVLETFKFREPTVQDKPAAQPTFSFPSTSTKRTLDSISEDDVFIHKQAKFECDEAEEGGIRYHEIRRKNNIASKNCRKTRKEKQKDMEQKVSELEQEREHLTVQVQMLEELIAAHKQCLLNAIAQKR